MSRFREYTKSWIENETQGAKKRRAENVLKKLRATYPDAKIALRYSTPFQLLVAVVLSAQCTDKKVNEVTKLLFRKYKTAQDFASLRQSELERLIYPTGFYRMKAKHIIHTAQKIIKDFGGKLPYSMEEMTTLPGVARKSANIILGNVFGVIEGIAVDTHVSRISQRLGLTLLENPTKIEQDLMKLFPKKDWLRATYYIIEHGRAICTARNRRCDRCPLNKVCPSSLV